MTRSKMAWGVGILVATAAACGDRPPLPGEGTAAAAAPAAAEDVDVVEPALRPRPPAPPTVLATVPTEEALDGLLVSGGAVLFGGFHTVATPPDVSGPPFEMVGTLRRVPAAGGAVDDLWTGNGGVNDIALGADALLFLAYDFNSRTGHLNRLPAGSSTAVELANWFSHGSSHSLDSAADVAYWTHSAGASSFVKRTAADATTTTLADSSTIGGSADNLVFKNGSVYFVSSQAQRTVYGMPADGSAPPTALYAAPQIDALAAAPTEPALFAGAGASLVAIDLRNGRTRTVFTGTGNIVAVAADDRAVYFGSVDPGTGAGAVTRLGRPGGAVVLASGTMTPRPVAVDATSVYWVDSPARTVSKVAK